MDAAGLITSLPTWVVFLMTTIIGVVAAEAGAWLAVRRVRSGIKEPEASIGSAVGAMLALLAFMLGFTFSITASRFADRKALVVQQANAIGTCYLRTSFIPEAQKLETRKLFREYMDLLLQTKQKRSSITAQEIASMDSLHLLIWKQAASLGQENMDSELRSLYVASVNEVIDIFSERKTVALTYRIPSVLWTTLFLLFVLGMFTVGYQTGTYSVRRIMEIPIMSAAFALIVVLIADMDTATGSRRFRISQQPLVEVQQMMQQDIP